MTPACVSAPALRSQSRDGSALEGARRPSVLLLEIAGRGHRARIPDRPTVGRWQGRTPKPTLPPPDVLVSLAPAETRGLRKGPILAGNPALKEHRRKGSLGGRGGGARGERARSKSRGRPGGPNFLTLWVDSAPSPADQKIVSTCPAISRSSTLGPTKALPSLDCERKAGALTHDGVWEMASD